MSEELQNENLPKEEVTELPKGLSTPDWIYPKDFDINAKVESMDNELLIKYHDLTHIYFDRILKGAELTFTLNELILLHYKIIKEFENRNLIHFEPINQLDKIHISNIEYQNYVSNMQKDSEKKEEIFKTNLFSGEPIIN